MQDRIPRRSPLANGPSEPGCLPIPAVLRHGSERKGSPAPLPYETFSHIAPTSFKPEGQSGEHTQQPTAWKLRLHLPIPHCSILLAALRVFAVALPLIPNRIAGSSPVRLRLCTIAPSITEGRGAVLPTNRTYSSKASLAGRITKQAVRVLLQSWATYGGLWRQLCTRRWSSGRA